MEKHVETIFSLDMPYRERMKVVRSVYRGQGGPRVAVVSGIHGDELEGLYLCHRIAAWLDWLAANHPQSLLGTIELYPGLNPLGLDTLARTVPPYGVDLNRTFPGHAGGVMPQRIADCAMRALAGCALVVDVHASNIYLREIPQVRINHLFADSLLPLAENMNVDVIWLHGAVTVLEASIAHSLNAQDVPALVVEMGVGMRLTPEYTEQLLAGLLNTWQQLGVLAADLELPAVQRRPRLAHEDNVYYLNAATSGLFVPNVAHWMEVRKDGLLGRIVSPLEGQTLAEVRSPVDGVLFTLREYPLVYEGSLMARVMAHA
ncbi:M14 family metallopeptidase [Plasticicumulans acidivorans]|uniref:Succinylglutamate desuccinylase/Aspartoacylase catalytic domain-containing protein n=1 Tax=Plasticicumulans acidivorans TaxID=886464 RepID=A0A317MZV0_9GAMM|nr:M14 family metallopeptidase [Plasticicumulans acidivorans]PWV65851.1 hypothetical protein C7443_101336 [Plasticicumulans acidivorans]